MKNESPTTPALLDQLIATLLAVFGVPLAFALRVLSGRVTVKARFLAALRTCERKGWALRRAGEDDATVAKRLRYIAWIVRDPWAARRRMVRGLRGWEAHRYAHCMTVLCMPPLVMGDALAEACGFESLTIDTS